MGEEERTFITPEIEKRQYRRAALVTAVRCEATGREAMLLTRDISAGGLFVTGSDPFPAGSEVQISLRLAGGRPALACVGKVVHSLPGIGMGIEFENLSSNLLESLQKFVDEPH
jgi:PilZ domain